MRRLIITTTRRHVRAGEPSGYIYVLDWENQAILQRSEIIEAPFREMDTNPRGGLRGAKGIAARRDQIAIANPSIVFRYDQAWNLLGYITHPSCAAIHDIAFEAETLWVTSSRTDILFQFDFDGRLLQHNYLRVSAPGVDGLRWNPPALLTVGQIRAGALDFRDPRTHRQEDYDGAHLNSVCPLPDGGLLVSLGQVMSPEYARWIRAKNALIRLGLWPWLLGINRKFAASLRLPRDLHSDLIFRPARSKSSVIRISPAGEASLCLDVPDVTAPCHSLLPLPDGTVIYLDTTSGGFIRFHPIRAEVLSTIKVTDGFLRGAALVDDQTIVLGSKADLLAYSLAEGRMISKFSLSNAPNESVFGIARLPSGFPLPPKSFARHLVQSTGSTAIELLNAVGGSRAPGGRTHTTNANRSSSG